MIRGVIYHCFCKGIWVWLSLCLSLAWSLETSASDSLPPLLKQSKILSCAKTESVASVALSSLWEIEDAKKAFPDESMLSSGESTLHAATLDIVLKSMLSTSERFPKLRNQVECTLLKWNYCDVFQDGVFYDLKQTSQGLKRFRAAETSPEKWQGFRALGFLGETNNRFIPNILDLDQNSLRSDYEWLFHRIYREQCFPHPDTAEMFDSADKHLKENIEERSIDIDTEYPHSWDSECVYPRNPAKLKTSVIIEILPLAVPALVSQLTLVPVPQLVPGLNTKIKLLPIAHLVPSLRTRLQLIQQPLAVPQLNSQVVIIDVPQLVPSLLTTVDVQPVPLKVPLLASKLLLEDVTLPVPKLATWFWVDEPKYVAPKKEYFKKAPVQYADNRTYTQGYYPKAIAQKPQAKVIPAPLIVKQPSAVLNKNASLIERLLGGLSGGGNVLIVDKIQLTVNEYNGTVETAISSSDIGNTVSSTDNRPEMVKEILNSLPTNNKQQLITETNKLSSNKIVKSSPRPVVIKNPKKFTKKETFKKSPAYRSAPELQTMLLVSEASSVRKAVKKSRRSSQRKQVSGTSSVFTYTPYPDGKNPTKEKSVKQLLLEYQQYERDRKLGRLPKKKKQVVSRPVERSVRSTAEAPAQEKRPDPRMRDVPPLNTELWVQVVTTSYDPVEVPLLKSRVKVYKKISEKSIKVPALSTMIIQQFSKAKPIERLINKDFEFAKDHFDDEVFEKTQIKKVKSINKQLDKLFEGGLRVGDKSSVGFAFSSDKISDKVFENTVVSTKKKIQEKKTKALKKTKPKKKQIGLAGNVYLKHSLKSGDKAIGGSINRKLIKDSYWFARVGWNYTLEESDDPFSYSWGIGYSDWHSGTFSAQLNNWGPIKPEEGLALEKAVASFGYSVKSEFLKKNKLSLSGAINVPIEGTSSAAANLRWSPVKNWYVNTSVSQPLEGDGPPKWTYGFGYSDWRPNKINLQYSNYGPNEIPYHNYNENGTWSLSYNWKF